ncbi:MAG: SufD family Fe-S cluster assembly protein [Thermoprotei archaeon]
MEGTDISQIEVSYLGKLEITSVDEASIKAFSRDHNEPEWLLEERLKAFEGFRKLQPESSPLFRKYVDLTGVVLEDYEYLNGERYCSISDTGSSSDGSTATGSRSTGENASRTPMVQDLHQALLENEPLVRKAYLSRSVRPESDKFAALALSMFDSGVFIYVPKGLEVNRPVSLEVSLNKSKNAAVHQTLIYLEENSSLNILQHDHSKGSRTLFQDVTDLNLSEGSRCSYSDLNGLGEDVLVFSNRRASVWKDSRVSWMLAHVGGSVVRSRLESAMTGVGSSSETIEVAFGDKEQRFDLVSDIIFSAPQSTGTVLAKAVMKDSSKSIMKGTMGIRSGAKNSRAFLSMHAMLLSKLANADAVPTLEIDTNEVKATHSAAVEQMDQESLFYLTSRGITEESARELMMFAFFEKAVERIPSSMLRIALREMIRRKWTGQLLTSESGEDAFEDALQFSQEAKRSSDVFEGHYKYRTTVSRD